jgi:hypothetical protein
MNQEEIQKKDQLMKLVEELDQEQWKIVEEYIQELEQKKIEELRIQLGARHNTNL